MIHLTYADYTWQFLLWKKTQNLTLEIKLNFSLITCVNPIVSLEWLILRVWYYPFKPFLFNCIYLIYTSIKTHSVVSSYFIVWVWLILHKWHDCLHINLHLFSFNTWSGRSLTWNSFHVRIEIYLILFNSLYPTTLLFISLLVNIQAASKL